MFPDQTWFIKGANHSNWTDTENGILYQVVIADKQLTIEDFDTTQFIVYDYETNTTAPMTAENCHTESWSTNKTDYKPVTKQDRLTAFLKALFAWPASIFKLLVK